MDSKFLQERKAESPKSDDEKQMKKESLIQYLQEYQEYYKNLELYLNQANNEELIDKILGCLYGAALGDAIGTTVEFEKFVDEETAIQCLACPGGGPFGCIEGQVTDDTELAYSIAHALIEMLTNDFDYDINTQAKHYLFWYNSKPFDIGHTTRNAFSLVQKLPIPHTNERVDSGENPRKLKLAEQMIEASQQIDSQSNGSLMRLSPLAVFGVFIQDQEFIRIVKEDASLTHSNVFIQELSAFYCLLIQILIQNGGRRKEAIETAVSYGEENFKEFERIKEWIEIGKQDQMLQSNCSKTGHAQYAFTYTIYCVYHELSYSESIKQVLMMAGDTDTNCAIVGAAVGCCEGFLGLPAEQKQVLDFDPESKDISPDVSRPEKYNAKYFLSYVSILLEKKCFA